MREKLLNPSGTPVTRGLTRGLERRDTFIERIKKEKKRK